MKTRRFRDLLSDICPSNPLAGQSVRVEGFATPARSLGRVTSPAVHKEERYSAFTYRFGVALAILVGS